jgi:acyl-CoA synthetase (AMP-forming)/AMP-acid ligase II
MKDLHGNTRSGKYGLDNFFQWQLPEIIFVDEIAKTSVGKFDKKTARSQYIDYFATERDSAIQHQSP